MSDGFHHKKEVVIDPTSALSEAYCDPVRDAYSVLAIIVLFLHSTIFTFQISLANLESIYVIVFGKHSQSYKNKTQVQKT